MIKSISIAAVVMLFVGQLVVAQESVAPPVTLNVGDAAPKLASGDFVKGEPVKSFEKGKSYIVEFWATWCGPCRASIPHLSKLAGEYKEITFIGQDCWEEDASKVKPFVDEMGDKMSYHVALDDVSDGSRGKMAQTWMTAAGEHGIPTAFLVNGDGKIAWIGHPMGLDPVLKDYSAGKLDVKKEADKRKAMNELDAQLNEAMRTKDVDKAISVLDAFGKSHPDQAGMVSSFKYSLLLRKKDFVAANALAKELSGSQKDDADALNEIAWSMVEPQIGFEKPDLDVALKCAQRAVELSKDNTNFADTLAHVYAAKGDVDKAIEVETGAIAKADGEQKQEYQKALDEWKAKKAGK